MRMSTLALIWSPGLQKCALLFQCDIGTARCRKALRNQQDTWRRPQGLSEEPIGQVVFLATWGLQRVTGGCARSTRGEGALEVVGGPEEVGLLSHESAGHMCCLLLVRVRVLHHPVLSDETLSTHVTRKRFFAGVQAHVSSQVCLVVELLRAHLTLVRLVSRVLCHVLLKQRFG